MNYICRVLDYMAWFWFMEWLILVYIINRIIHGRLEIWNLSSRVHIRYLTRSLRSLVRYRCEHSKINSISPRDHVLFSICHQRFGEKSLTQTKSPIPPSKSNARPLTKFSSCIDGLPMSLGMEFRYKNLLSIMSLQGKVTKIV